jgi:hypothetical protein
VVPRRGEKFWPSPERVAQLRSRGDAAVAYLEEQGFDVIGDVADLRTPAELPQRRHPDSVTDAEMLAAATATIAEMMTDVRWLTQQQERGRGGTGGRGTGGTGSGRVRLAGVRRRVPAPAKRVVRKAARRARDVWRRP